jgi:hypothetical protein
MRTVFGGINLWEVDEFLWSVFLAALEEECKRGKMFLEGFFTSASFPLLPVSSPLSGSYRGLGCYKKMYKTL